MTRWDEQRARNAVKARSTGRCEIGCGRPGTDAAHRSARSRGGQWVPWNLLWLCRSCHAWTHAHPAESAVAGWRLLRTELDPADVPVWMWSPEGTAWWVLTEEDLKVMVCDGEACPDILPG